MPRADFVCLGRKCQTEGQEAPVYELPLGAVACPVCGSRRIKRLFNKVNVSTEGHNIARRVDGITEQAWSEQRASQLLARDATARWGPLKVVPTRAVPQALANTFGELGAPHIANQVAASAGQQFRPVGGKPKPEDIPTGDLPVRQPPVMAAHPDPNSTSRIDRRYRRVRPE